MLNFHHNFFIAIIIHEEGLNKNYHCNIRHLFFSCFRTDCFSFFRADVVMGRLFLLFSSDPFDGGFWGFVSDK